jgi:hypothetical protein
LLTAFFHHVFFPTRILLTCITLTRQQTPDTRRSFHFGKNLTPNVLHFLVQVIQPLLNLHKNSFLSFVPFLALMKEFFFENECSLKFADSFFLF